MSIRDQAAIDGLADAMVDALRKKIDSGEATAADFKLVMEMMEKCGIQIVPRKGTPAESLIKSLPTFDDDLDEKLIQFQRQAG